MQDVLFELGTEELPSGLVEKLAKELHDLVLQGFQELGLTHGESRFFATPRRMAFFIESVPSMLPTRQIVKRGPQAKAGLDAQGNPTQALQGFARSCGVEVSALKLVEHEKNAYWEYHAQEPGADVQTFLVTTITTALSRLTIPKPMRWGSEDVSFARPLHWVNLMYGDTLVAAEFFGLKTKACTYGHRFMHPQAVDLQHAREYQAKLKDAYVIADFSERRQDIIHQIETLAHANKWYIPLGSELLDEITSIVEWPHVLVGGFDQTFLTVPEPVLIACMQQHQKCLPVYDKSKHLLPYFIAVSNLLSENPEQVKLGNEKVMRARLSDAMFFYQQDRREPLIQYQAMSEQVIFEQRLGSLADKSARVLGLSLYLAHALGIDATLVARAVSLSKCDLMTGLVGEFPELQGSIGQFYALGDGEDPEVAEAMYEQYLPRFSGDELPKTNLGYILSLADRLDTLVGIFAIGLKPTGEKDPYKLRRHALAVVRLILSRPNTINIDDLLAEASRHYGFLAIQPILLHEVKQFIIERMQSFYLQQSYPQDWFNAGLQLQSHDWYDLSCRLNSFSHFMRSEQSSVLTQAAKRVKQILAPLEVPVVEINTQRLLESSEQQLWQVIQDIRGLVHQAVVRKDYDEAFQALLHLANPLAAFFEQVFVMTDDLELRHQRLNLLSQIQSLLNAIVMIGL